jgi:hypothetical protein
MKAIRVLCLHGLGDSAEIFRAQTGTHTNRPTYHPFPSFPLSFPSLPPRRLFANTEPEFSWYSQLTAQTLLLRLR